MDDSVIQAKNREHHQHICICKHIQSDTITVRKQPSVDWSLVYNEKYHEKAAYVHGKRSEFRNVYFEQMILLDNLI